MKLWGDRNAHRQLHSNAPSYQLITMAVAFNGNSPLGPKILAGTAKCTESTSTLD